ncbi:host cell division inhibitor Icd-like protein [Salmonella enterica subsp. diarizonae]|nr:host cell division inhibitor Icd-like protein [Salmonella enterica subsp. diarizonae]EDY0792911.1 host cell division inhibitor Icd-like protein [Salmonella enterica subsp. diarizonae]
MTHYTRVAQNATPRSVPALPRRLTTNQPESIEVAMRNNNTQREKILPFTVCNAYVQCKAWCSLFAVFVHISANSMTHHASCNGAVFFDGVGMASTDAITNDTPRRPLMVGCYVYLSGYAYPGWYGILLIISQCITSDRPIMVLLVGERSRSLANLLAGLPIPASDATSATVKKCLRTYNGLGYVYPAPHKTGAGFDSLNTNADSRDNTVTRSFCVRNTTLPCIMAGRNGGALALAGFVCASLSTLLRLATPFDSALVRSEKPTNEAVTMVNANPCTHPKFIWRFFSCQQSTYHTVTATSEREARAQIPDAPCLFAARIRLEGVNHA